MQLAIILVINILVNRKHIWYLAYVWKTNQSPELTFDSNWFHGISWLPFFLEKIPPIKGMNDFLFFFLREGCLSNFSTPCCGSITWWDTDGGFANVTYLFFWNSIFSWSNLELCTPNVVKFSTNLTSSISDSTGCFSVSRCFSCWSSCFVRSSSSCREDRQWAITMLSSFALCRFSLVSSNSASTFSILQKSTPFSFAPLCIYNNQLDLCVEWNNTLLFYYILVIANWCSKNIC